MRENNVRRSRPVSSILMPVLVLSLLIPPAPFLAVAGPGKDSGNNKRDKIRKMADETLQDLYKLEPASRGDIKNSAGYAVFDNMGVHVLLLSTARGGGIAVGPQSRQEVFMKMISVGAGLGMGVKDYRVVFVFETQEAFD